MSKRKRKYYFRRLIGFILVVIVAAAVLRPSYHAVKTEIMQKIYPLQYRQTVEEYAQEYGLAPLLVTAFIRTESGFDASACSDAGARGLMQLTEETYSWVHSKLQPAEPWSFDDMFEPEQNIRYGCYFLAYCLQRYDGDLATAAAAYYSGCGAVDRLLGNTEYSNDGVTLTTFPHDHMRHYVNKILNCYQSYLTVYGGTEASK